MFQQWNVCELACDGNLKHLMKVKHKTLSYNVNQHLLVIINTAQKLLYGEMFKLDGKTCNNSTVPAFWVEYLD